MSPKTLKFCKLLEFFDNLIENYEKYLHKTNKKLMIKS
jgi:hypothetical protein